MAGNRPRSRQKNVTGAGKSIRRRGSGLGTGPVGSSGKYIDSYMLGEQLIVDGELLISDVYVEAAAVNYTYLFTDIYNQKYWTNPVP